MRLAVPGPGGHLPSRPMAGWLMVYALIGAGGELQLVRDRDDQVMEAASELGRIDWSEYLRKGEWNDTHDENVIVGKGTSLEFHDAQTSLAQQHRKVGFFTSGHLYDRADPASWQLYTSHKPNAAELARADHFWNLAIELKNSPRPLGFSAHGDMQLSPCRRRVLSARTTAAAICALPKNPATTVEPMIKALHGSPLDWLRKGQIERAYDPCRTCTCPPDAACLQLLRKGVPRGTGARTRLQSSNENPGENVDRLDITSDDPAQLGEDGPFDAADRIEMIIEKVQARYFLSRSDALKYLHRYLLRKPQE